MLLASVLIYTLVCGISMPGKPQLAWLLLIAAGVGWALLASWIILVADLEAHAFYDFQTGPTALLTMVLLAPLAEELLFRGSAYRYFAQSNQNLIGAVLLSFSFAGLHMLGRPMDLMLVSFPILFISSGLFFLARHRGGVTAAFVTHASYNFTLLSIATAF